MSLSLPGNVPRSGRDLIPKITKKQRREKRRWSHSFGVYEDERSSQSLSSRTGNSV
jgi:hypothetical protein